MESNLVETIFEAITVGDRLSLARCLENATITTVFEFETTYGESPLHLCVKLGGMDHLDLVRCLLSSGLMDFDQRDSEGQTVLEYAYKNEEFDLVNELIKLEIANMDNAAACYKMLKHNSLDLFKMFLATERTNEADTFMALASAIVKINVKNFVLSKDLRLYVQLKLSDYGYRNLSGNWPGTKNPSEWKRHIGIIGDCWRVISVKYDTRMYDDVDDQLLHRLYVIHNYMYFLKHTQFLSHLPMHEIVFCLAMFISIFKNSAQFNDYRMAVNKCLVMDFVRMVYRQLELIKTHLEIGQKELVAIMQEIQDTDTIRKDRLMEELLEKIKTLDIPNKIHWIGEMTAKIRAPCISNKDALIKEMLKKIKSPDKALWVKEIQTLDETNKLRLMNEVSKRLPYMSHPQNVANRLMAGWRKGRNADAIVAEIIAEECFDHKHLLSFNDRRIIRKAKKCYVKTKQIYSLHKVVFYCDQISAVNSEDTVNPVAAMMRIVQVFGEAVKNTQNSPNLPGKTEQALKIILTELFPEMNISMRELLSHNAPLKKLLVDATWDKTISETVSKNMRMVRATFQLLYVIALADMRQSFYGCMLRCGSIEALRSLLLYAGDTEEVQKRQHEYYIEVKKYFTDIQKLFTEIRSTSAAAKTREFMFLEKHLAVKCEIVFKLDKYFEESTNLSFAAIRQACLAGGDFSAIQWMMKWKLTMRWVNEFFYSVRAAWVTGHVESNSLECIDPRLLLANPSVIAGVLKFRTAAMDCVEEFDYIKQTRKLIRDVGISHVVDDTALQELNDRLKSYYDNIYFVDNKWKILTTFCNARKIQLDKRRVDKLLKRDQDQLQKLFDDRREKLRSILEKCELNTVDNLVKRLFHISPHDLVAIELLQLELSEILAAVGYFGDSFHYMKHRIPMIQGKTYRNYLAHDTICYNVLSDSSVEKVVINAFVFVNNEIYLFSKLNSATEHVSMSFPSVEDTHRWVDEQTQMIDAFRTKDVKQMLAAMKNGGEIRSQFCCSPNKRYVSSEPCHLTALVDSCDPDPTIVEFMGKYFKGFSDACRKPTHQLATALVMRNFQAAFDRTIGQGATLIREELFEWPELMPSVRKTDLFVHLVAFANRHSILKKLIEHGNERGVREILPYFDCFRDTEERGPLGDALLYNMRSISELLIHRTAEPHLAVLLLAIIIHWDDIFERIMARADINAGMFKYLFTTTAQARNYTAALYLLENGAFKQYMPQALQECYRKAVLVGAAPLLQHLLQNYPTPSSGTLAELVHDAARKKHWKCVSILLARNAPVDKIFPTKIPEDNNVLIILVKYGLTRLLDRVKAVNCLIFANSPEHPFAVAIRYGMANARMIRTLRRLGFDWTDSSLVLHESIRSRDLITLTSLWQKIDDFHQGHFKEIDYHHLASAITVLKRWQSIGFVEEPNTSNTSLIHAVMIQDRVLVQELLDRAKSMRQLEGIGILSGIVFKIHTINVCFGRKYESSQWNVQNRCDNMVTRLKSCATLDMRWQKFSIDVGMRVEFHVLSATRESQEPSPIRKDVDIRKTGTLLDSLNDFVVASNALFAESAVVAAHFMLDDGSTRYFWQVEEMSCAYNILPTGADIDISETVNFGDDCGETALHTCFPKNGLAMVQLLVEAGANPLLGDEPTMTPIQISLLNSIDYAIGRYLFDICVQRQLRNDKGLSLQELDDGKGQNRLIHTAILTGRQDIVQRLLNLNVDVSVVNTMGLMPIHLASSAILHNRSNIVKMLLDYDASAINTVDASGNTILHNAVQSGSIATLKEILKHGPDLTLHSKRRNTALGMAILMKHCNVAKCLLNYAIEKGIRGVSTIDDEDLVFFSLFSNDFELSQSLLEYELEHSLNEIDLGDLPRVEGLLEKSMPTVSNISIWELVEINGWTESQYFLSHLKALCISLKER